MHRRLLGFALAIGLIPSMLEAAIVETTEVRTIVRFDDVIDHVDSGAVTTPLLVMSFNARNLIGSFDHQINFAWPRAVPLHAEFAPWQSSTTFTADFSATLFDQSGAVLAQAVCTWENVSDHFTLVFADVVPFETYTLVIGGVGIGGGWEVAYAASVVPVPPAILLFATALGGLFVAHGRARRRA